ncbi:MAG: GNAT family N-acetyltransferase [Nitrospirae bacterium]|nr:GNAT family N-acetyltransferase [Nitrospirota bacterium]
MVHLCTDNDFDAIFEIVNDAAQAYKGVIPDDRWHEPYMPRDSLRHELESGVAFWGYDEDDELLGVMGIQDVQDVTLIRHAYVRTADHGKGIGSRLISHLKTLARRPMLVGTWQAAIWAVRFYERHGFKLVSHEEKERLLRNYWNIPERQTETSVVLADERALTLLRNQSFPA